MYTKYFARASAFDDITISADTSWAAGTYNYNNITVNNAATLTIAGNSVVHADTTILLEGDGKIVAQGDTINNKGVEFEATTLTINSGSSISANGQGYTYASAGSGGGSTGTYNAGADGGSYGGEGGDGNDLTATHGVPYGSIENPASLGSAGGTNLYNTDANGGSGGGYIKITVSGEIANGGSITANGSNGTAGSRSSGGGSGGSIYIVADTISGVGSVTAHGGNGSSTTVGGAGGGGRIALIYTTSNSIMPLAYGGNGYQYGGAGTIYIKDTDDADGDLYINNNDQEKTETWRFQRGPTTPTTADLTVDTITLSNKAFFEVAAGHTFAYTTLTWDGGYLVQAGTITFPSADFTIGSGKYILKGANPTFDNLTIQNGGTLSHWGNTTTAAGKLYYIDMTINQDLTIEAGGSIDVSQTGYYYSEGPGAGSADSINPYNASGNDGASYGGEGGDGRSGVATHNMHYGSITAPDDLGSGGGTNSYSNTRGGSGGGLLKLNVVGELLNGGTILADGGAGVLGGADSSGGGGSGGSIYITADTISGAGTVTADGGIGATKFFAGGGGGGRIALIYTTSNSIIPLAYGGQGYKNSAAGTVYIQDSDDALGDLYINNNDYETTDTNRFQRGPTTPTMGNLTVDTITLSNKAFFEVAAGHTFAYTTLTWDGGYLVQAGTITFPSADFTIGSGKYILKGANPTFDNLTIQNGGTLSHWGNTTTAAGKLYYIDMTINVDLTIEAGGSIDVSQVGYYYSQGPGAGSADSINPYNASGNDGASYGGEGGDGRSGVATHNMHYGSITAPDDLGSGGGTNSYSNTRGGSGGGLLKLNVVGELLNGGTILADGGAGVLGGADSSGGGGSGGSIYITADTISGAGTVTADGGIGATKFFAGGGGGGRIALIYTTANSMSPTAYGGNGYQYGGAGTIYIKDTDDADGDLYINNNDQEKTETWRFQRGPTTPTTADLTVDTITLSNKAFFEVAAGHTFAYTTLTWDGGYLVQAGTITFPSADFTIGSGKYILKGANPTFDNLTIQNGGTLSHWGNTTTAAGKLYYIDMTINVDLTIEAGGSIDVSQTGYYYSEGPGAGSAGAYGAHAYSGGDGASFGGEGGNGGNTSATHGAPYGSITAPEDIGSGGGTNTSYWARGGSGGGQIKLNIAGELINGGTILADGGAGVSSSYDSSGGGGSGGTIFITADTISGVGTVTADGGNGTVVTDGGGGGGGRIALIYTTANSMSPTAYGGNGYEYGAAGTVYIQDSDDALGDLYVNNNGGETVTSFAFQRGAVTPTTANLTVDTITLSNKAFFEVAAGHTFAYTTLTWDGGYLVQAGTITFPSADFTIGSGKYILKGANPTFDNLTIQNGGTLSHWGNTTTVLGKLYYIDMTINQDLTVEAGGSIDVSQVGYYYSQGPGAGSVGNYSNLGADGGSYGGEGGDGSNAAAAHAGTYGSRTEPDDLGSAGGMSTYNPYNSDYLPRGGSGGGLLKLNVTGQLINNGTIASNGGISSPGYYQTGGGGSGGSINIHAPTVSGSGTVTAHGGAAYKTTLGGGGSGGRIAIIATTSFTLPSANVTVTGGDGYDDGDLGTIYIPPTPPVMNTPTVTASSITWKILDTSVSESEFRIYDSTDTLIHTITSTTVDTYGTVYEWEETSLSMNTQYSRYATAYSEDMEAESSSSNVLAVYTLANIPLAPTLSVVSATAINIVININSNSANTEFAIYNQSDSEYVQADGTLAVSEAWQTYNNWGGVSGINNISLSINSQNIYQVKARNGDNVETALSDSSSLYTLANPPSLPAVNSKTTSSITWGWNVNSNPAGTEFYATDATGNSGWVADATSWANALATANTEYTVVINARNGDGVETTTITTSAYTNIETPNNLSFSVTPTQIQVSTSNTFSNLTSGSSGVQFCNATTAACSSWQQNTNSWTSTLLDPDTVYIFTLQARNADSETTAPYASFSTTSKATKIVIVLPGQNLVEGNGLTGDPDDPTAGSSFNVDSYAVDDNYYIDPSRTDLVTLTATDPSAELPVPVNLVSGQQTLSVTLNTSGEQTLQAETIDLGLAADTVDVSSGTCSASLSTVTADPTNLYINNSSTITVTLKDELGNLISGHEVTVSSNQASDVITYYNQVTDENGQIVAYATSPQAHVSVITATDTTDGVVLNQTASITFNDQPVLPGGEDGEPPIGNQAPVAKIVGPTNIVVKESVKYDGTGSYDNDGNIVAYSWVFSDDIHYVSSTVEKAFSTVGLYQTELAVTDNDGAVGSVSAAITVRHAKPTIDRIEQQEEKVIISGTGEPGETVVVYINDENHFVEVVVDENGNWTTEIPVDSGFFREGNNDVWAIITDEDPRLNSDPTEKEKVNILIPDPDRGPGSIISQEIIDPLIGLSKSAYSSSVPLATAAFIAFILLLLETVISALTMIKPKELWAYLIKGRDRKNAKGLVYDSQVGVGVPLAKILLFRSRDNKLIRVTTSGSDGRFALETPQGETYYLEVRKEGYDMLSKTKTFLLNPVLAFENNYLSGFFEPSENQLFFDKNIPISANNDSLKFIVGARLLERFNKILRVINIPVLLFGFLMSSLAISHTKTPYNYLILSIYILILVFYLVKIFIHGKNFGLVINQTRNEAVDLAVVRTLSEKTGKLVKTTITNIKGKYALVLPKGTYKMTVAKPELRHESPSLIEVRSSYKPRNEKVLMNEIGLANNDRG